jgi:hypothetical protein
MTVRKLIELLQTCDPEAVVRAFDADSGMLEEVSGVVTHALAVDLQTDDNQ